MITNLVVCITFFYNNKRLVYLKETVSSILEINVCKEIHIVTNTFLNSELESIYSICDNNIKVTSFQNGHPFLLAWSHFHIFQNKIKDTSYTHFLYLEDDIKFSDTNFTYWIKNRDILKMYNVYPAFFRYEIKSDKKFSTDVLKKMSIYDCNIIQIENNYFINTVYPYQGMYLYDRELMIEFFNSPAFNPDFDHGIFKSIIPNKPFNIREKAALGLTFYDTPKNFRARTFLPIDINNFQFKNDCLIHHIPNNYTLDCNSNNGKIEIKNIFNRKSLKMFITYKIKILVKFIINLTIKKIL